MKRAELTRDPREFGLAIGVQRLTYGQYKYMLVLMVWRYTLSIGVWHRGRYGSHAR